MERYAPLRIKSPFRGDRLIAAGVNRFDHVAKRIVSYARTAFSRRVPHVVHPANPREISNSLGPIDFPNRAWAIQIIIAIADRCSVEIVDAAGPSEGVGIAGHDRRYFDVGRGGGVPAPRDRAVGIAERIDDRLGLALITVQGCRREPAVAGCARVLTAAGRVRNATYQPSLQSARVEGCGRHQVRFRVPATGA